MDVDCWIIRTYDEVAILDKWSIASPYTLRLSWPCYIVIELCAVPCFEFLFCFMGLGRIRKYFLKFPRRSVIFKGYFASTFMISFWKLMKFLFDRSEIGARLICWLYIDLIIHLFGTMISISYKGKFFAKNFSNVIHSITSILSFLISLSAF